MKIDQFRQLISESIKEVLVERAEKKKRLNENKKLSVLLKSLIAEIIEEKTIEFDKTCVQMEEELNRLAQGINKTYSVKKNDAGNFELCGCEPYHIHIRPRWNNNFEILAYKDKIDRTKKIGCDYDEVKDFLKSFLTSDKENYINAAYNKSAENSVDKEKKKNQGDKPQETDEKVVDAVKKEEDLPDKPMQSDHSLKGEKAKYKYPKQKDDNLTVKFK
jgi:diadenosine tetraphosphate (Ap4A) HIT family hydrolase